MLRSVACELIACNVTGTGLEGFKNCLRCLKEGTGAGNLDESVRTKHHYNAQRAAEMTLQQMENRLFNVLKYPLPGSTLEQEGRAMENLLLFFSKILFATIEQDGSEKTDGSQIHYQ